MVRLVAVDRAYADLIMDCRDANSTFVIKTNHFAVQRALLGAAVDN